MKTTIFFKVLQIKVILFVIIGAGCSRPTVKAAPAKYPNGLLTSGFDIVTEDDLAYDSRSRDIVPYDPKTALSALYWQCFPLKEVKAKYRTWNADDERGRPAVRCSPEVSVQHNGELQLYVGRRGHEVEDCKEFVGEWKRLTKGQEVVCLNGEGGFYSQDEESGKYKLWTWTKVKTKRGCHSYFVGECKTIGCSKGKCPPPHS